MYDSVQLDKYLTLLNNRENNSNNPNFIRIKRYKPIRIDDCVFVLGQFYGIYVFPWTGGLGFTYLARDEENDPWKVIQENDWSDVSILGDMIKVTHSAENYIKSFATWIKPRPFYKDGKWSLPWKSYNKIEFNGI